MTKPFALLRFHMLSFWNWRNLYLGKIIEPLAYFGLLAPGIGASLKGGLEAYLGFVLLGMVGLLAFRSGIGSMVDIANDRKWGVYAAYRLSGGGVSGYITSVFLFYLLLVSIQMLALGVLYLIMPGGTNVVTSAGGLVNVVVISGLLVFGWVAFGALVGIQIQSYARRDLITTLSTLPVVLAAPVFYTLDSAPTFLRWISSVNPLTYQLDALRLAATEGTFAGASSAYGLAALWCVVAWGLAFVFVRRSPLTSNER